MQPGVALGGQPAAGRRLEAFAELEQLGYEVIEREAAVVERPLFGRGVAGVVKMVVQPAGDVEAAGRADHADGVEPIGVLQDAGFQRDRLDAAGKTVRLDGMRHLFPPVRFPADIGQDVARLLRRQSGRQGPIRRVLLDGDAIMQQHGRHQDLGIAALVVGDDGSILPHPQNVGEIVAAVGGADASARVGQKKGSEAVVRREQRKGQQRSSVSESCGHQHTPKVLYAKLFRGIYAQKKHGHNRNDFKLTLVSRIETKKPLAEHWRAAFLVKNNECLSLCR
ncbi:hypothetical protein KL86PLE_20171 [uncultured Pleomorphomonas sp.]|uniref:Uncharacterized protein n=1 Tax=uncultured Pleomorphomonas sp. TaxID=442121 RepID=A0A212LD60_9HYPH|nr:hypothetical protein KL86PLE_20171 [uncultured Pleomorphomonas sp.]